MRRILKFPVRDIAPPVEAVLKAQGLPDIALAEKRFRQLAEDALAVYSTLAKPIGIISEISKDEFERVYQGEGHNEQQAPLAKIYKQSENLALFAVTIGQRMCDEISRLFDTNDLPVGSMLDSAASEGTELTAETMEKFYREYVTDKIGHNDAIGTMRFSPGYCGWHISAQKKLFEFLNPGEAGIELNNSYLMAPLKSISGVIVVGKKEIFQFDDLYDFCLECKDHSCQDRIRALMKND